MEKQSKVRYKHTDINNLQLVNKWIVSTGFLNEDYICKNCNEDILTTKEIKGLQRIYGPTKCWGYKDIKNIL